MQRRDWLQAVGGGAVCGWNAATAGADPVPDGFAPAVNRHSAPSDLKITDLRYARLTGVPHGPTVIRIDTNQGLSGWGEVRDGASPTYALFLKSRLLGQNPCQVDRLFRRIKQFGGHGRLGGGVSAVEMALWDLAGKAYGVPVYQLLGGQFRDQIRLYADTRQVPAPEPGEPLSGKVAGQLLLERIKAGLTWLKSDIGIGLLRNIPGTLAQPYGSGTGPDPLLPHPFTGIELTRKGIELLAQYVAEIREVVGQEIPLAVDHLGHLSVNSVIRLAQAWEPYTLAWIEDPIPWQFPDQLRQITHSVSTPILTGEDIYLKEGFQKLIAERAVDWIHPDLATAGGLWETRKIGDLAGEAGIPMAIHCSGTPLHFLASMHCAAATENFVCLEHHALELPWWETLVTGLEGPLVKNGHALVPNGPGLGAELNLEVAREYLDGDQFFGPTPEWDQERAWDRTWS